MRQISAESRRAEQERYATYVEILAYWYVIAALLWALLTEGWRIALWRFHLCCWPPPIGNTVSAAYLPTLPRLLALIFRAGPGTRFTVMAITARIAEANANGSKHALAIQRCDKDNRGLDKSAGP